MEMEIRYNWFISWKDSGGVSKFRIVWAEGVVAATGTIRVDVFQFSKIVGHAVEVDLSSCFGVGHL
eukprot:gene5172-7018_t